MSKYTKKQKVATAIGAGALVVAGAGSAIAYWTTDGTGSGDATVAASNGSVSYVVTYGSGTLAPGAGGLPVTYKAYNTGSSDLVVTDPTAAVTGTSVAGCLTSWFHVTSPAAGSTTVPHGTASGSAVAVGTGQLTMDNVLATNQDPCKSATVTVTLTSS